MEITKFTLGLVIKSLVVNVCLVLLSVLYVLDLIL
jgi:hypothetical protein